LKDLRRVLGPAGTLVLSGGGTAGDRPGVLGPIGLIIRGQLSRLIGNRVVILTIKPDAQALARLTELAESGKLTPVIDRTYPLTEVPEALRYLTVEHARAKVVITV
jgi:NADPH:quinone reductase-like Zn-dependent oxidoreductase